jgi:DNA replication protein DnaC
MDEAEKLEAANNELKEKRKRLGVTEPLTPSMRSAQNRTTFGVFVPLCEHGISRADHCPECDGLRKAIEEKLQQEEDARQTERAKKTAAEAQQLFDHPESILKGMIPEKFLGYSLEGFKGGETAKTRCRKFIVDLIEDNRSVGMLFTGPTGSGKTHLAVSIIRELVRRGVPITLPENGGVEVTTMPELLIRIRSTYKSKDADADTEAEVMDRYSNCGLLLLDDLGAEKVSDFSISTLYVIIDKRNRELKPTIITTNLSLETIGDNIDKRISSRLSEMTIIQMAMADYRKKRAAQHESRPT